MKLLGCLLFLIGVAIMIFCIVKKYKLFKVIPAYIIPVFIIAIIFMITKISPLETIKNTLISNSSVNPLKIIILFLSMSFLSIYLDELGFFKFVASKALERQKSGQIGLFIKLYILISILTIFTSNDIIILTFTPFIIFFCKHSNINPLPYLINEFIAANTWSMFLLIGNPTNIYLSTYANISFFEYIKVMVLPTLTCGLVSFSVLFLLFKKSLKDPITVNVEVVKLKHKYLLADGLSFLVICIILLSISSYINLEMSYITLICFILCFLSSLFMCVYKHGHYKYLFRAIKRLPYEIIPFLLSMFIIILGLDNIGISYDIASFLAKFDTIYSYGITSALSCNVMNNIPMSVLFANLSTYSINSKEAIYASIIGSNLGAIITPIGALAGIMFTSLIEKEDIHIGYIKFAKYGFITAMPSLILELLVLSLVI